MRQVVYVFVGAMLIVAPGTGNAAQRSDRFNALRQIAMGIGSVSGAASVCREISWPRMKVLTGKFSDLLRTSVTDSEEFSSIQQAYDQSTIEGQLNVASRQVDCAVAVRDLAELERAVTSLPPAAVAIGASAPPAAVTTGAAPSPALPTTCGAVAQPARADAHKADARTASKEASTGEPSDASNLQRGKTTPASRVPYWERRGRHERGAAAGGYTMSPPSTTFAPPSYGVGAAGGDPGGLY
jgi:hypothetical protein